MKQSPDTHSSSTSLSTPQRRRALVCSLPLVLFQGLAVMPGLGLRQDPSRLPSPLIGRRVPSFKLPALDYRPPGLVSNDLIGEVSLVNGFASLCVTYLQEHPLFMKLADWSDLGIRLAT